METGGQILKFVGAQTCAHSPVGYAAVYRSMVVIEQLIAQIVQFIACQLFFSQQNNVVRQRSLRFAFLAGKSEIRHHGKSKAVNEVRPYCAVFLHGDNISD